MADNTVEILVDARAAAADADLDVLKEKLRSLGRTVETAKVKLDGDKDAEVKLARMNAALITLGRKVSNPKITVEGAAKAEAEILAIGRSLDRLNDKGPGILSRLGASFVSAGAQAGGLASSIGLILVPIAALVAIISGPLIASLLPITAGFAAFAAGAVGEIKKVIEAHQKLQAAQQAYEKATTKAGRQSALKAEKAATEDLTGSERGLLGMLGQLGAMFKQLERAVRPQVVEAFGTALTILKQILPTITPLAVAAGKALNGFLNHIHNWLNSSSGQKFLIWMQEDGPKAIATFGRVLWDVAQGIGRTFSFLRNAGNSWWKNVTNGSHTISKAATQAASVIAHAFGNVVHAGGNVVHAFGNVVHAGGNVVHAGGNVVHAFGNVVHAGGNVVHAAGNVIHAMGNVVHAFGNVVHAGGNVVHAGDNVVHAFGNMSHAAGNVAHAIGNIVGAIQGAIGWFGRLASAANSALGGIPGKVLGALGFADGGIVGAASGGVHGGMRWVGERGPELVRLPLGSTVYPAGQSAAMAAQQGSGGDTYNIHVQVGPGTAPAEVGRQIAYYLAEHKKRGGMIYQPAGFL